MAQANHWMQGAFANAHGQLHRELHVPMGKRIPMEMLNAAIKSGGEKAKRAQAVKNMEASMHR